MARRPRLESSIFGTLILDMYNLSILQSQFPYSCLTGFVWITLEALTLFDCAVIHVLRCTSKFLQDESCYQPLLPRQSMSRYLSISVNAISAMLNGVSLKFFQVEL